MDFLLLGRFLVSVLAFGSSFGYWVDFLSISGLWSDFLDCGTIFGFLDDFCHLS